MIISKIIQKVFIFKIIMWTSSPKELRFLQSNSCNQYGSDDIPYYDKFTAGKSLLSTVNLQIFFFQKAENNEITRVKTWV